MHRGLASLIAVVLIVVCGCIRVQTGPMSEDQKIESSERTAKDARINWKMRFDSVEPAERGEWLRLFVDSASIRYIDIGNQIANQWREGNEGRGREVDASEMRQMVDNWLIAQKPVLDANEDIIDYALESIERDGIYDRSAMDRLFQLRDVFNDVYAAVFLPQGTQIDYIDRLDAVLRQEQQLSQDLGVELARYR